MGYTPGYAGEPNLKIVNGKLVSVDEDEDEEQIQSSVTGITKDQFTIDAPEVIPKKQDKRLEDDLLAAYAACEEELKNIDFKE